MSGTPNPLDAYLPARLLRTIGSTDGSAHGYATARLYGAALFVDIRGYTDLTERLCRAGPHGVEQLKRLISRAFASYIDTIYGHGGEVALFAGDALLAVWEEDQDGLEQALGCADALRRTSPTLGDPDDPSTAPQLRIGIGLGEYWCAAIGPATAPELVVSGPAVLDAMRAKRDAAPGEILVRAEVARRWLNNRGTPSQSGAFRVVTTNRTVVGHAVPRLAPVEASLRQRFEHLIHPAVRATASEGNDAAKGRRWLAERRRVLPLFARFDVGDLEHPAALARAHELMSALRSAAASTVGAGGRLLVDDNGLVFLMVFGTPQTSRGRELERAFELASSLRAASRALDVACAVGIAGGDAFCGALGTDRRREYVTIGRPMNLAARLMNLADDAVLVDHALKGRSEDWLLEPLAPRQLKGIADPVTPARVLRPRKVDDRPLIGRTNEIEHVESALVAASATQGVVVLIGQAGLGKSALLEHVARRAVARGERVVAGGAGVPDAVAAYSPIRPLLCAAFGVDPQATPRELQAVVHAHLARDPDRAELGSLLNGALGIELPDTPTTLGFRGQDRAEATLRLLTHLVVGALSSSAPPTLILVEDLHWIDSASVRLFAQLLRAGEGLRIMATSRPTPASAQSGLMSLLPVSATVSMGPLRADEVGALLEAELGERLDDPALVEAIVARTSGNPLMCREYALSLREGEALERGPRGLRRRLGADVLADLPDGVQGLISSRIDRLAPVAQRALKTGAVLGRSFSLSLLALVLDDVPVVELEQTLAELEAHRLVEREGHGGWLFDHASIRETAYDLLLYEQRTRLHQRAAVVLTDRYEQSGPEHATEVRAAELVRHWAAAGDPTMTLRFADEAADEAIDAGAWREAVGLLARCLELTADEGDPTAQIRRIRWMRKLSEAHGQLGHNGERRQYAFEALELAGVGLEDRHLGARLRSSIQMGRLVRTYVLRPGRGATRIARSAETHVDPMHVEFARAHSQAATVAYFEGDGLKLLTQTLAAIDHAEAAGLPGDLIRRYAELGGALGIGGLTGLADRHIGHALELARGTSDSAALVYVNMVRALYYCGRADWATVQAAADEGQALAQRLQLWNDWGNIQIVRAWMHLYRGEYEALHRHAQSLLERAIEIANDQQESWARRALGMHQLRTGDPETAVDAFRRALVAPERDGTIAEQFECYGSLALALARSGHHHPALDEARRAIDLAERVGTPTVHTQAISAASLAQLICERYADPDETRRAEWGALERGSLSYLQKCARTFPVAKPHLEQARANWLRVKGRARRADVREQAAQRLSRALDVKLLS